LVDDSAGIRSISVLPQKAAVLHRQRCSATNAAHPLRGACTWRGPCWVTSLMYVLGIHGCRNGCSGRRIRLLTEIGRSATARSER
jgi:hypothetical protein